MAEVLCRQHRAADAVATPPVTYPRIANLYSFGSQSQVSDYVHDGLVVASPSAATGNPSPLSALKARDPGVRVLLYLGSDFVAVSDFNGFSIYPGWWLTLAGTSLTASIDISTTTIPVADAALIAASLSTNPDVLVDGESMHVTAVNKAKNTLTVQRGYRSKATNHAVGARLAAHETPQGYGAWMLNVTAYCPHNPATGQTWTDYLSQVALARLAAGPWDGMYFDNLNPDIGFLSNRQVDADNDNIPDAGNGLTTTAWLDGEARLLSKTRSGAPHAVIVGNLFFYPGLTDGVEFEHFPLFNAGWIQGQAIYLRNAGPSAEDSPSILNPDTSNSGIQNLRLMREGLATALMGSGYFAYDYGTYGHGQAWWYDEYDNGAGSSLRGALSASADTLRVASHTGSRFASGDIIFVPNTSGNAVGNEQMLVRSVRGDTITVQRGYNNTDIEAHAARAKVVTQAQLNAGAGWLGMPLGPGIETGVVGKDQLSNGGFETDGGGRLSPWTFGVTAPAAASISRDTTVAAAGHASARITVRRLNRQGGTWSVQLLQGNLHTEAGHIYTLSFRAKASGIRTADAVLKVGAAPYTVRSSTRVILGTRWQFYTVTFTAKVTEVDALLFAFAQTTGTIWIDDVHFMQRDPGIWRRVFTNGMVLLNETNIAQSVSVGPEYRHILGTQDSALNDGAPVSRVTLPPSDGMLLVHTAATAP